MSLIHLMTRWEVHTSGSTFWCSHWIRRACSAWETFSHRGCIYTQLSAVTPVLQGAAVSTLTVPPYQSWVGAAVRCPAAGWPDEVFWRSGDVPYHGGWGSSAFVRPPGGCERPGSTEADPHHSTRPWPPSGGPCLRPWIACKHKDKNTWNIPASQNKNVKKKKKHLYLKSSMFEYSLLLFEIYFYGCFCLNCFKN